MVPGPCHLGRQVIRVAGFEVQPRLLILYQLRHGTYARGNHWQSTGKCFDRNKSESFNVSLGWPNQKARAFDQLEAFLLRQMRNCSHRGIVLLEFADFLLQWAAT